MGQNTKNAEKKKGWEANGLQVRVGMSGEQKKGDPSTSSNLLKGQGGDRYINLLLEAWGRKEGEGSSLCGWVKQEALIRHVRAEVILDVSHAPAGQLVLGQIQAQAAQLENRGLRFRSLQVLSVHKEKYRLSWVVHDHSGFVFTTQSMQALLLVVSMMKLKLGLHRPEGLIISPFPSGEQQTDNLLYIIAWPKDKIHFLCASYHIPSH